MNEIKKSNWVSSFKLVGKVRINDNTFKIDEVSDSGWQYNSMNLGVDCGEKCGTVYANMMGGFSTKRNNVIYVHGKKDDGTDDFRNRFTVDWDDRFDDEVLDSVGDFCFLTMGFEKTVEGKTFRQNFLSAYDAIAYTQKHLTDGTPVCVKGNIKYSFYNNKVSMQREITNISVIEAEPSSFEASFNQSILIDSESIIKSEIDTESKRVPVHARVLDYVKEIGGQEIKGQYPMSYTFDFDFDNPNQFKAFYDKFFKVKNGVINQINFEGKFVNSGAVITATMDDVPDDIKELITLGMYTEEEILTKYATQGASERRCVLTRPMVRLEGDENPQTVAQVFTERYTEDDLVVGSLVIEPFEMDDDLDELFANL